MTNSDIAQFLDSRPVLVAGAGVSGAGCARLLTEVGAQVIVADDNDIARQRVHEATGATDITIAEALDRLDEFGCVVTSPGWRPETPLLVAAEAAGLPVFGDVEIAWRLDQAGRFGAPRTWVAITGTNGKTTTTAMCAAMIDQGPQRALAVGNIGLAVHDALMATPRVDVMVCELSSFQLYWCDLFAPSAGVLLNIAEDHLDWHGSLAAYAAAKSRVLRGPVAVIGGGDELVAEQLRAVQDEYPLPDRRVITFSLEHPLPDGWGIDGGALSYRPGVGHHVDHVAPAEGISPPGPAGQLDALAAAALARSCGATDDHIAAALRHFEVAGHRGQVVAGVVGDLDSVAWIDNSKATNPHAAAAALAGIDRCVWVAGGQLKGACVGELVAEYHESMLGAVLIGVDRGIIAATLAERAPGVPVTVIDDTDPEAAMEQAVTAAAGYAEPGCAVVLAPAAASLDMYEGMSQRGDLFARYARAYTNQ